MTDVYPKLTVAQVALLRKMQEHDAAELAAAETIRKERAERQPPASVAGNRVERRRAAAAERKAAKRRKP